MGVSRAGVLGILGPPIHDKRYSVYSRQCTARQTVLDDVIDSKTQTTLRQKDKIRLVINSPPFRTDKHAAKTPVMATPRHLSSPTYEVFIYFIHADDSRRGSVFVAVCLFVCLFFPYDISKTNAAITKITYKYSTMSPGSKGQRLRSGVAKIASEGLCTLVDAGFFHSN